MNDVWKTWVGDRSVAEFLEEMDEAVAEGVFPNRRAAFVEYAHAALTLMAFPHWGPDDVEGGVSADKLADLLLAHALRGAGRPAAVAASPRGG